MAACEESLWQPTNQSINQRRACGRDLFLFLVVVVGFVFDFVFRCGWFVATGELVVFGRGWLLLVREEVVGCCLLALSLILFSVVVGCCLCGELVGEEVET